MVQYEVAPEGGVNKNTVGGRRGGEGSGDVVLLLIYFFILTISSTNNIKVLVAFRSLI